MRAEQALKAKAANDGKNADKVVSLVKPARPAKPARVG